MKNQRLKQFAASFLVVLSLFVSSVSAACTCSHEPETGKNLQTKSDLHADSAHRHSHKAKSAAHQHETDSPEIASIACSESDCCCAESAPRVFAKAENVKIEKYQATVSVSSRIEIDSTRKAVPVKTIDFAAPFYLSDSFHNLTPGRAPPCL